LRIFLYDFNIGLWPMKIILIVSHQRSGTHFLIDSIVKNFNNAVFPHIRPSFSTVENLLLPHDNQVTENFYNFLFSDKNDAKIKIFKTHLLPDEFEIVLNNKIYFPNLKDRKIVEYIYKNCTKIYITRDVYDVIVSLYYYMKNGGGLQNAMRQRLAEISLYDFIRMPNYHIMPCRGFSDFDRNIITYWSYHIKQWSKNNVLHVSFEDLTKNFEKTIHAIAEKLDKTDLLVENISKPIMKRPSRYRILDVTRKIIKRILKIKSNNFESTAVKPRKGIIGDHKTIFSEEDYDFIKKQLDNIR